MPIPEPSVSLRKQVLVVDDDATLCEIVSRLLAHLGYETRCEQSAVGALDLWAKDADAFSFVFTDVIMPEMDGLSLARLIRKKTPKMPILLLSGQLNEDSRWIVSEEGFYFLQKPFTLDELKRAISMLETPVA